MEIIVLGGNAPQKLNFYFRKPKVKRGILVIALNETHLQ
jgi:hypothetical protein